MIQTNTTTKKMMPADWSMYWRARAELADRFGLAEEAEGARIQGHMALLACNSLHQSAPYCREKQAAMWSRDTDLAVRQVVGTNRQTGQEVSDAGTASVIPALFSIDCKRPKTTEPQSRTRGLRRRARVSKSKAVA